MPLRQMQSSINIQENEHLRIDLSAYPDLKFFRCPRCNQLVNKAPELNVIICKCGFNTCWVCGLTGFNWFHLMQLGIGFFCEHINKLYFNTLNWESKNYPMHWAIRLLILVVLFVYVFYWLVDYFIDVYSIQRLK